MVLTERSHEGEIFLDHRASPGFSEEESIKLGYGTKAVGSTLFEAPTRTCNHCGTVVIINPDRQRARAKCYQCNMYICDNCEHARHQPDYVHITKNDIIEAVKASFAKGNLING